MITVRRIAVLRALPGVGDLLCAVPALRALRAAHPTAWITLVGLPSSSWFVRRFSHLVDDLLAVEGVSGLPEVEPDPRAVRRFEHRARARRFDLAIQLHGNGTSSNAILARLGARHQVSVYLPDHRVLPGTALPYRDTGPEIHRMLDVVAAAGCPPRGDHLELPLTCLERRTAAALTAVRTTPPAYACIHPGASQPDRCWSIPGFAAVADHLIGRGLPVVVTGTAADSERVHVMRWAMDRNDVCDLTGRTSLGVLGAVYRQAQLVVTNDSGPSHVAAAVRVPSVVIGSFEEADRWAPLDRERHRTVADPRSRSVVQQVIQTVDEQLARWGARWDAPATAGAVHQGTRTETLA